MPRVVRPPDGDRADERAPTVSTGDNLPAAESLPIASTRLLRGSDEPFFQRLRPLQSERDADPQTATLADISGVRLPPGRHGIWRDAGGVACTRDHRSVEVDQTLVRLCMPEMLHQRLWRPAALAANELNQNLGPTSAAGAGTARRPLV